MRPTGLYCRRRRCPLPRFVLSLVLLALVLVSTAAAAATATTTIPTRRLLAAVVRGDGLAFLLPSIRRIPIGAASTFSTCSTRGIVARRGLLSKTAAAVYRTSAAGSGGSFMEALIPTYIEVREPRPLMYICILYRSVGAG